MVDNLNIHCCKSLTKRYGSEAGSKLWQRFTVHYTPIHGSWLNQAEIAISLFARQCLGRRRIPDLKSLRREARLESPHQLRPHPDQLALRPSCCSPQVWLYETLF